MDWLSGQLCHTESEWGAGEACGGGLRPWIRLGLQGGLRVSSACFELWTSGSIMGDFWEHFRVQVDFHPQDNGEFPARLGSVRHQRHCWYQSEGIGLKSSCLLIGILFVSLKTKYCWKILLPLFPRLKESWEKRFIPYIFGSGFQIILKNLWNLFPAKVPLDTYVILQTISGCSWNT